MGPSPAQALPSRVDTQNGLLTDEAFDFQPWQIYAARQIRSGHFPLWNPHAFGGAPLLGNPQSSILFPFSALAYVMPVSKAVGLEAILKDRDCGSKHVLDAAGFGSSTDCGAGGRDRIHDSTAF